MVNAYYFVQSQLEFTAVRDSGRCSWLCILSSTSAQQRAARAAANPFSFSINVAASRASRVLRLDIFDEVCFSTYIEDVARAQKFSVVVFCGPSSEVALQI